MRVVFLMMIYCYKVVGWFAVLFIAFVNGDDKLLNTATTSDDTRQLQNSVDCLDSSSQYQKLPTQTSRLQIKTQLAVFGIYDVSATSMVRQSLQ